MQSVIIVDDHPSTLKGMKEILELYEFNVLGTALDDVEFWNIIHTKKQIPDVVLLDIILKTVDGLGYALAKTIKQKYPSIKILACSSESNIYNIKQMIINGANGFIDKGVDSSILKEAIIKVSKNESYYFLSIEEDGKMKKRYFTAKQLLDICVPLTYTEKCVLQLLSTDLSYADIGKKIDKNPGEIEYIRKTISTKINVHTRQEMVLFAAKNGFA